MIACSLSLLPMIESTALPMPILCVRYYSAMIASACMLLSCVSGFGKDEEGETGLACSICEGD